MRRCWASCWLGSWAIWRGAGDGGDQLRPALGHRSRNAQALRRLGDGWRRLLPKIPRNHWGFGIMSVYNRDAGAVLVTPSGVANHERTVTSMPSLSSRRKLDKKNRTSASDVEVQCASCGTALFIQPARAKRFKRHFCDRDCRGSFLIPIEERFWGKVEKLPSGCWLWRGADKRAEPRSQYGHLNRGRQGDGYIGAHVFSYELHKGPVPEGMQVDHLCRHPWCVNPNHLEAVTATVNIRRRPYSAGETCINGHPRTPENTAYRADGSIHECRVCKRERRRA